MAEGLRGKSTVLLLIILLIAAAAAAAYFYTSFRDTKRELDKVVANPSEAATEATKQLVDEVSKKIELPQNENPTIATITDREKLKDQQFFAKSENGDKVLIYPSAKKVFLYRPSTQKVIEVGTINLEQSQQTQTGQPKTEPKTEQKR